MKNKLFSPPNWNENRSKIVKTIYKTFFWNLFYCTKDRKLKKGIENESQQLLLNIGESFYCIVIIIHGLISYDDHKLNQSTLLKHNYITCSFDKAIPSSSSFPQLAITEKSIENNKQ